MKIKTTVMKIGYKTVLFSVIAVLSVGCSEKKTHHHHSKKRS